MSQIEPTYLRYMYDALSKGSLNSQNSASLPNGFIGFREAWQHSHPGLRKNKVSWQLNYTIGAMNMRNHNNH